MDLKKIQSIVKKPIITKADIKKQIETGDEYAYQVLQRLTKRKIIEQVIKGKYTAKKDPLLVASNLYTPCYISFLASSNFYGYTEQTPAVITSITTINKEVEFKEYTLKFLKHKKNLFGYKKIQTEEGEIFMAEPEKLLLDSLNYQRQAGNFQEVIKILRKAELNRERIVQYLKRKKKKALIKRTGFLLEKEKNIDIREEFRLDNNYANLEIRKEGSKTSTKWRIKHDL